MERWARAQKKCGEYEPCLVDYYRQLAAKVCVPEIEAQLVRKKSNYLWAHPSDPRLQFKALNLQASARFDKGKLVSIFYTGDRLLLRGSRLYHAKYHCRYDPLLHKVMEAKYIGKGEAIISSTPSRWEVNP